VSLLLDFPEADVANRPMADCKPNQEFTRDGLKACQTPFLMKNGI
jgi:hypothetical protein